MDIVTVVRFAYDCGLTVARSRAVTAAPAPSTTPSCCVRGASAASRSTWTPAYGTHRRRSEEGELMAALDETGLTCLWGSTPDPTVVGLSFGGGMSWFGRPTARGRQPSCSSNRRRPAASRARHYRARTLTCSGRCVAVAATSASSPPRRSPCARSPTSTADSCSGRSSSCPPVLRRFRAGHGLGARRAVVWFHLSVPAHARRSRAVAGQGVRRDSTATYIGAPTPRP